MKLRNPAYTLRMVLAAHRRIESSRKFRHEIEDGRGIGGDAHLQIGERESLGRGQPADIGQAVAHAGIDPGHQLDIADAVLEANEVGAALAKPRQVSSFSMALSRL